MPDAPRRPRPRVVVIGAGFGGLEAARVLGRAHEVDVTVIDRANHHLFQPLLYQVATAALAPTDITAPIRWLLGRYHNTEVVLGDVDAIDPARRIVHVAGDPNVEADDAREVRYDFLIVATGSHHAYFGHDDWEPMAPGLKSIENALEMRRRFLLAFERAERSDDPAEQAALMTFVIVGGGPTGVELAGVMPSIARDALRGDFRRIDTSATRVILLEGGPRVLSSFPEELSRHAQRDLEQLGVEVRTGSVVTGVTPEGAYVGTEFIPARTIFWAAGNTASELSRFLDAPLDRAGRVRVAADLSVPQHPELFVAGDMALVLRSGGEPVPGVAPAAMQEGRAAARNVLRTIRGEPRRPFHYVNKGNLAAIGRARAVADFGRFHLTGRLAWLTWLFVHILYLAGFRNRLSVLVEWAYAYFTYQRGSRLITEHEPWLASTPPIPPEETRAGVAQH